MIVTLLGDILFGVPLTLCREVLEKLRDEIDRERLVTEESIKARLQQLQLMLQDGELSEEDYAGLEGMLMERLRAARQHRVTEGR